MAYFVNEETPNLAFGSFYDVFSGRSKDMPSEARDPAADLCDIFISGWYEVSKRSYTRYEAKFDEHMIFDYISTYTLFHYKETDPDKIIEKIKVDTTVKLDSPVWFSSDLSECGNGDIVQNKTFDLVKRFIEMFDQKVGLKTILICDQRNQFCLSDPSKLMVRASENGFNVYLNDSSKMLAYGLFYRQTPMWPGESDQDLNSANVWTLLKPDVYIMRDKNSNRAFAVVINQHEMIKRGTPLCHSVKSLVPANVFEHVFLQSFVENYILR